MSKKVSGTTGRNIPCCWSDCTRDGNDQYEVVLWEGFPERDFHYLFCSDRHRAYWIHSKHANGQLPIGSKGLLAPR